jgi:hypothetical protein
MSRPFTVFNQPTVLRASSLLTPNAAEACPLPLVVGRKSKGRECPGASIETAKSRKSFAEFERLFERDSGDRSLRMGISIRRLLPHHPSPESIRDRILRNPIPLFHRGETLLIEAEVRAARWRADEPHFDVFFRKLSREV